MQATCGSLDQVFDVITPLRRKTKGGALLGRNHFREPAKQKGKKGSTEQLAPALGRAPKSSSGDSRKDWVATSKAPHSGLLGFRLQRGWDSAVCPCCVCSVLFSPSWAPTTQSNGQCFGLGFVFAGISARRGMNFDRGSLVDIISGNSHPPTTFEVASY